MRKQLHKPTWIVKSPDGVDPDEVEKMLDFKSVMAEFNTREEARKAKKDFENEINNEFKFNIYKTTTLTGDDGSLVLLMKKVR